MIWFHLMRLAFVLLAGVVLAGRLAAETALSYADLVRRLTDLEELAVLPAAGERCGQWSSYDRSSRWDAAAGKYVAWDANGDGGGFIRREGDQVVMAEMEGPGCIVRIWSAAPKQGHVRIYLDGASEPAVDLPFMGYFDRQHEPFTRPALVHTVAMGWNNYTPIPYQKSCRIVADPGWGDYYHFGYMTFAPGTRVPVFRTQLSAEETAALDAANLLLSRCGPDEFTPRAGQATVEGRVRVGGHGRALVGRIEGPRALVGLDARLELPPTEEAQRQMLRELALQIRWDGEATPSVWAPFGDFYGTAPGANPYRSLPLGLTEDGWWYCRWYMPFARSAVVELVNDGRATRQATFRLSHAPLTRPIESLARFHAHWHRDVFLPSVPERAIDWTMLSTTGSGRFVGVMLHIWNPRGGWWGEGDEKFFVDGEPFPSTFGTGSEDYFGYAWSNPTLFQNAFHNQTIAMGNRGHISVNRWHISDNVPFQRSFEAAIEKYFPNARPTLYAATAYWYLAAGGRDPYGPSPLRDRLGYWTNGVVTGLKGVLEGERLQIRGKTGGTTQEQGMDPWGDKWSGDAQLWWIDNRPGNRLELALPVTKPGRYRLSAQFTKARDYGIVQVGLDGVPLDGPIDLYNPDVVPTGAVDLGARDLTAGDHLLTLEIVGANPAALPAYMVGLDYVRLEPEGKR